MPLSEARKRSKAKYNAKTYDRIAFDAKKGDRNKLKQYVKEKETSLNKFIYRCVSYCIENDVDLSTAKPLSEVLSDKEE